jgi:hypothetical protein
MGACFGTWVAQVADLSVDKNTGKIKVHKVYVAVDCGPAVNPGPIVEQMESGVIMGLSTALKEQVKFCNGREDQTHPHDPRNGSRSLEKGLITAHMHITKNKDAAPKRGGVFISYHQPGW